MEFKTGPGPFLFKVYPKPISIQFKCSSLKRLALRSFEAPFDNRLCLLQQMPVMFYFARVEAGTVLQRCEGNRDLAQQFEEGAF